MLIVCPQFRPVELRVEIGPGEVNDRNIAEAGLLRFWKDGVAVKVVDKRHDNPDELNPVSIWRLMEVVDEDVMACLQLIRDSFGSGWTASVDTVKVGLLGWVRNPEVKPAPVVDGLVLDICFVVGRAEEVVTQHAQVDGVKESGLEGQRHQMEMMKARQRDDGEAVLEISRIPVQNIDLSRMSGEIRGEDRWRIGLEQDEAGTGRRRAKMLEKIDCHDPLFGLSSSVDAQVEAVNGQRRAGKGGIEHSRIEALIHTAGSEGCRGVFVVIAFEDGQLFTSQGAVEFDWRRKDQTQKRGCESKGDKEEKKGLNYGRRVGTCFGDCVGDDS